MKHAYLIASSRLICITLLLAGSSYAHADGTVVDKVYHPYVDALEKEIEFRSIFQDRQPGLATPAQVHKLALGTSLGESWFGEVYLIGEKNRAGDFKVEAYELELKWQLSEQGEYAVDWGVLFEYENVKDQAVHEAAIAVLAEKEWGRWSGAANFFLIREWGADVVDEFETSVVLQARYRYSSLFEPALEFYKGENSTAFGPVLLGSIKPGVRKRLNWEIGLLWGVDEKSPNKTFRMLVEYEF